MHTFILRIYICGIQLQEQRYHISGIAVPVYWNSGAILAGIFNEQRKSTIVCSQRDPASWKAMILNDEVSANSIMKRATKHYTIKINTR